MIKQMGAFPEPLHDLLKEDAKASGLPIPELLRGIVWDHYAKKGRIQSPPPDEKEAEKPS